MRGDRHGRSARTDGDRRRRPVDGFRMHDARRFAMLVDEAVASLPQALLDATGDTDVAIEEVPPDEEDSGVPLARFEPAVPAQRLPARLTVYRRPLELRALSRADLAGLIRSAAGREVARALGREAEFADDFDDPEDW